MSGTTDQGKIRERTTWTEQGLHPDKPLGGKSYGSIGHLPGSRRGPADRGINDGQSRICQTKARDKHDIVIVQEKLDGSNVAVLKKDGNCVPLIRAGYLAIQSNHYQHRLFADWTYRNYDRFDALLNEGERVCGEWLVQCHGTRYNLPHEPFVAFDIMIGMERASYDEFVGRIMHTTFVLPCQFSYGPPCKLESAIEALHIRTNREVHGSIDLPEGVVYRVERLGKVDFLAKWVDPNKIDGAYFPEITKGKIVWNTWTGHEEMWTERFDR